MSEFWNYRSFYPCYLPVAAVRRRFIKLLPLLILISVVGSSSGVLAGKRSASSPHPPPPFPSPSPPPAPPMMVSTSLQGKLLYRTNGNWILMVTLSNSYMLPSQPVITTSGSTRAVPTGSWISLVCFLRGSNARTCSSISGVKIDKVAAPAPSIDVTLKVLVMVISLSASSECGSRGGADVTEVLNAFTGPNGYMDYFKNCSYGKMVLDRRGVTVASVVVPCSIDISTCNANVISDAARQHLPAGSQTASFTHLAYVIPKGLAAVCGWVGLAEILGPQTWFSPDNMGIFSKGTVMQELLHSFGLYHSWKEGAEYEDYSTAMGSGDSCPSGPELWRLGWATPLAQLNSSSFPLATFKTFTLPATYLGPEGVLIKIQPDWLGASYTRNVYLAFRVKAAGDQDLQDEFHQKLNLHELDKNIDNNFYAEGDPKVSIIGVINPTSSVTFFSYKLHLLTGALSNNGSVISLHICRFIIGPNECMANNDGPSTSLPQRSPPPKPRLPTPPLFYKASPPPYKPPPTSKPPTAQTPFPRAPKPPPPASPPNINKNSPAPPAPPSTRPSPKSAGCSPSPPSTIKPPLPSPPNTQSPRRPPPPPPPPVPLPSSLLRPSPPPPPPVPSSLLRPPPLMQRQSPPPLRLSLPPPSSPQAPTIASSLKAMTISLKGQLFYQTSNAYGSWAVVSYQGKVYQLPIQPVDTVFKFPIPSGSSVYMTCYLSSSALSSSVSSLSSSSQRQQICSSVAGARITPAVMPMTYNITISVLVVLLSLRASDECGSAPPGASVASIRNAFLATDGYAEFFRKCSYGKLNLDRDTLTVVSVAMPCSRDVDQCDESSVSAAARKQLSSAGIQADSFSQLLYVLPKDYGSVCGWASISDLPGRQSWFSADSYGIFAKGTVMQEMLNNLGLYNAWRDGIESSDSSTAMGFGDSCPSAPELRRLGWATPLAQLNSSSFPLATFKTFTLPATYLGPTGVMIMIQPDWLGTVAYKKNLYLSLRVRAAGDRELTEEFNGKLSIHELNKDMDNDFFVPGDPRVSLVQVINPGSAVTFASYKLALSTNALVNGGSSIPITLCRFADRSAECASSGATLRAVITDYN